MTFRMKFWVETAQNESRRFFVIIEETVEKADQQIVAIKRAENYLRELIGLIKVDLQYCKAIQPKNSQPGAPK